MTQSAAEQISLLLIAILLVCLFVPARLLKVRQLQPLRPPILWLAYQGKWLGLATAAAIVIYTVLRLPSWQWSGPAALLTACLGISLGLSLLSNKWSYAHITYWKHLNMLVWLMVPFLAVYALTANAVWHMAAVTAAVVLLVLCALAAIAGLFEVKPGYFAWHRVVLLAAGLVIAVLAVQFFPAE